MSLFPSVIAPSMPTFPLQIHLVRYHGQNKLGPPTVQFLGLLTDNICHLCFTKSF